MSKRKSILDAARKLFVKQGFSATSINQIEEKAEVTRSLIFHYFKTKENLWLCVKQEIVKEAKENTKTLPDTALPFLDFLHELFTRSYEFYTQTPDITRMINWQRMEKESSAPIGITRSKESKAWLEAIKHYQKTGDISKKHKPEYIMTMILSISSSAALDSNALIPSKNAKQQYIDFCASLLGRALKSD